MVGSRIAVLALSTLLASPEDGPKGRVLEGSAVEADGRPSGGAEVLIVGESWDGGDPVVRGKGVADASGRFRIELPGDLAGCDHPTAWAVRPGSAAASLPLDLGAGDGPPLRLTLGRAGLATFDVVGPDGRPVERARVTPLRIARGGLAIPRAVAALASASTDAGGRAVLASFRPDEVAAVLVEADGLGVQVRDFAQGGGMAGLGPRAIRLKAAGRVEGRVVADDPRGALGRSIRLESSVDGRVVGVAGAMTDGSGRFEVAAIAAGLIAVRVRPDAGSPDLAIRSPRYPLEAGGKVEAEVALRRGVRVAGLVRDSGDGRGVPGVVVAVVSARSAEPRYARTDAEGRYETTVPPGPTSRKVLRVPDPYLGTPPFEGPRPSSVPPAIAGFELPPIDLERGDRVRGRVVDEAGEAVAGARVEASWTLVDERSRVVQEARATAGPDGSFVVGPVAPGVDLTLVAALGPGDAHAIRSGPVVVRSTGHAPAVLTLGAADAVAPSGRVVDAEGRPVPGARVHVGVLARSPSGSIDGSSIAHFEGLDDLRADAQGRFRGPKILRRDREYRVQGSADGHLGGRTRHVKPGPGEALEFPDLVLAREPTRVAIEGRVLDRQGRPVAGALVRTWAPGFGRPGPATTGPDGRFRIEGVADEDGFVFAGLAGFRTAGRAIDPDLGPVDLTLARRDESPDAPLTVNAPDPDPGRARAILETYLGAVLDRGDHATRARVLERVAAVDPARALRLIEGPGGADPWFADQVRASAALALIGSDPGAFPAALDAIADPQARTFAALGAAATRPALDAEARADLIERALRDARAIADPADRVAALALVADRLADLGEVDRARGILDEARKVAIGLSCSTSGGRSRAELARSLARFDPAAVLELTDDLIDPRAHDRARIAVAVALAPRDPAGAARILDGLRDPRSIGFELPELARSFARSDPARARALLDRPALGVEPCVPAYALGMMAAAAPDPKTAKIWLLEAFDRLEAVARAEGPGSSRRPGCEPATVAASLLPAAEGVDPALVPELFWRALALHDPGHDAHPGVEAVLALLVGRYDHKVALTILEPLADRAAGLADGDLAPLIAALAAFDPARAAELVEALPDAPDPAFHHPKNDARLALADALARPAAGRPDDAVRRFLHFWTPTGPPLE